MSEDTPKYDAGKKESKETPYQIKVSEDIERKIQELVMSSELGDMTKRKVVTRAVKIGINEMYEKLQRRIDKEMEE